MAILGEGFALPHEPILAPLSRCLAGEGCGTLLTESDWIAFIVMTLLLGGGCAFLSGRAMARGWSTIYAVIPNMVIFGFVIRFLHWGVFRGTLLHPWYLVVDTLILIAFAALGFQLTRTRQMVTQYHWLYRRTGPFSWGKR